VKIWFSLHLLVLFTVISCAGEPISREGGTTIDKVEKCTYRLIEKNGISATEAQKVCTSIFRNIENVGRK